METLFFNINYFHQFFLVAKKLMTSAYNNITDDIKNFFTFSLPQWNMKGWGGRGGGGAIGTFQKTTFEKTSFIRFK